MPGSSRSSEGEQRGVGWVVAQFAVIAAILAAGWLDGDWSGGRVFLRTVGLGVGAAGIALFAASVRSLGSSLTVFPRPREDAELVQSGPYQLVRHPIYSAGLLGLTGFSLAALSRAALALTLVLALLWYGKARVEERWLRARFPAYADYARRVRGRLVPWLL